MSGGRGKRPAEGDPDVPEVGETSSKRSKTFEQMTKMIAMSLVGILKKAPVDNNGIHELWDKHAKEQIEECVRSVYDVRHLMASLMSIIVGGKWDIDKIDATYLVNVITMLSNLTTYFWKGPFVQFISWLYDILVDCGKGWKILRYTCCVRNYQRDRNAVKNIGARAVEEMVDGRAVPLRLQRPTRLGSGEDETEEETRVLDASDSAVRDL
jgi:hypothetical protein